MESEYKTVKEWYEFNKQYIPDGQYITLNLYQAVQKKQSISVGDILFSIDLSSTKNRMAVLIDTFGSWVMYKIVPLHGGGIKISILNPLLEKEGD